MAGLEEDALLRVSALPRIVGAARIDAPALFAAGQPALLAAGTWRPALEWTWPRVRDLLAEHVFDGTIRTRDHRYMPTDANAALAPLLGSDDAPPLPRAARRDNVTAALLLDELAAAASECGDGDDRATETPEVRRARRLVWRASSSASAHDEGGHDDGGSFFRAGSAHAIHFDSIPPALRSALQPHAGALYTSGFDAGEALQYMWLSSPGLRTHTHFDSDANVFVQLLGRKRFVLWAPNQTSRLCPYPRLHPLWHKSRVDFETAGPLHAHSPALPTACSNYSASEALAVDVLPGDVLYLPPFWWHTVETLTPSLSLSTLSRWPQLYNHVNAIYKHQCAEPCKAPTKRRSPRKLPRPQTSTRTQRGTETPPLSHTSDRSAHC